MALLLRKIIETPCSSDDGVNEKVIHTYLENSVGSEKFKDLMIEKLPDVLVSLFRSLHDPNFEIPPRSILPSPAPFRADERLLLEMIDYLQVYYELLLDYNTKVYLCVEIFIHFFCSPPPSNRIRL